MQKFQVGQYVKDKITGATLLIVAAEMEDNVVNYRLEDDVELTPDYPNGWRNDGEIERLFGKDELHDFAAGLEALADYGHAMNEADLYALAQAGRRKPRNRNHPLRNLRN